MNRSPHCPIYSSSTCKGRSWRQSLESQRLSFPGNRRGLTLLQFLEFRGSVIDVQSVPDLHRESLSSCGTGCPSVISQFYWTGKDTAAGHRSSPLGVHSLRQRLHSIHGRWAASAGRTTRFDLIDRDRLIVLSAVALAVFLSRMTSCVSGRRSLSSQQRCLRGRRPFRCETAFDNLISFGCEKCRMGLAS